MEDLEFYTLVSQYFYPVIKKRHLEPVIKQQNFKPDQIGSICSQKDLKFVYMSILKAFTDNKEYNSKNEISYRKGKKTFWEKEKMLVISIF